MISYSGTMRAGCPRSQEPQPSRAAGHERPPSRRFARPGAGFLSFRRKKMPQVLEREEVVDDGLETMDHEALSAPAETVLLGPAPQNRSVLEVAAPANRREEQELWLPFPLFSLWLALAFLAAFPM